MRGRMGQAATLGVVKIGAFTVVGILGIYLAYAFLFSGGGSSDPVLVCELAQDKYRVVKVYEDNGKLSMTWFVYGDVNDQTSEALLAAQAQKASVPGSLYHQFYSKELCNGGEPGQCKGLALDIGAFLGTHALYLARLGLEVHAFEPYKATYDLLRCSKVANKLNNLMVVREGISNEIGKECLLEPLSATNHLATFIPKGRIPGNCTGPGSAEVVTLDHYWKNVLDERQIDFIKIDVEGHEDLVLQGASEMLAKAPPKYMLMEFYPKILDVKDVTPQSYINRINKLGYRIYDCQQNNEIRLNDTASDQQLAAYEKINSATDFLLVRKSDHPESALPRFSCGY